MSLSKSTNYLKIGQAAKALGVSIDTLRRWERTGKITTIRTPGGTRLYSVATLKKLNPASVEHFHATSQSTEELLRLQGRLQGDALEVQSFEIATEPEAPRNDDFKRSFVTKFLISTAVVSAITLAVTSWITASYLTHPQEAQQFFKNNVASGILSPFHKLAEESVMVISPKKAHELGFTSSLQGDALEPPPINIDSRFRGNDNLGNTDVLAVTSTTPFLEVNSDTQINGSLFVRDQINNITLEGTPSASTINLTSGDTTLTVSNTATIDQDISTTSSPTFTSVNAGTIALSATTSQITSGGFSFTLPGATTTLVGTDTTQTLTNKSMSGSSNTFTSIPNSALSNSAVTVTAGTNLTGGGTVSLGGSVTISAKSSPSFSGQVLLSDGTAAAPGLAFTDDADTGLYRIGSNRIGLITAGSATSGISIDASGNVGVGIIAPTSTLHIVGTGNITSNATIGGTLGVTGATTLSSTLTVSSDTTVDTDTFFVNASTNRVGIGTTSPVAPLHIWGDGTYSGIFLNGNVGINTSTPSQSFQVNSGVNSTVITSSGNIGVGITTANSNLTVIGGAVIGTGYNLTAPTNGLLVQGLVGIGTTSPGNTLAVNGGLNLGTFASSTGPANGLAVSGNVGIGITTANSTLSVAGGAHIGAVYQGISAPANGLFVDGNVGIGATTSSNKLDVWGNARITGTLTLDGTISAAGSGVFLAPDGSAMSPSYAFTSDLDTGLFRPGNNSIGFTTDGATRMTLTSTGLGIGVTAPAVGLAVSTNALIGYGNGINGPSSGLAVSGNVGIGTTTTLAPLHVWGNGTNSALFLNGNVGIGITTPGATLAINGNSVIGYSGVNIAGPTSGLAVSGNVGIGTTSPLAPLQVWGNNTNSAFFLNGNIGIGTTAPAATFSVGSSSQFQVSSTGVLTVSSDGSNTITTTISSSPGNLIRCNTGSDIICLDIRAVGSHLRFLRESDGATLGSQGITTIGSTSNIWNVAGASGVVLSTTGGLNILYADATGNVGIGVTSPGGRLQVNGGGVFWPLTTGVTGPSYGLAVSGNVGIGITTANSTLSVAGSAHIGSLRQGIVAPANGLFVDGNVGIGATTSNNILDVWGNTRITGTLTVDGSTTNSGVFLAPDGTASAPGYSFSADTNTGLYRYAADSIALITGGISSNLLSLNSSGNVGIGTTSPNALLDVRGAAIFNEDGANVDLRIESDTNPNIFQIDADGNTDGLIGIGRAPVDSRFVLIGFPARSATSATSTFIVELANQGTLTIPAGITGEVDMLRINEPNLTATGTITNATTLHIVDTPTEGINNYALWVDNGISRFDGNVGIGTSLPNATLSIQGNVGIGYTGANQVIPSNGLAVSGNVGIGITTANSVLTVAGGAVIGTGFNTTAPTNGLLVQGNVGLGTTAPAGLLQVGSSATTPPLLVTSGGSLFINDVSNANMTQGLTINQSTNDDEILSLKSSDVAHGVTTETETDSYGIFRKVYGDNGGLWIKGITDGQNSLGLFLQGIVPTPGDTTKTTAGRGIVELFPAVSSGTTLTNFNADANLAAIRIRVTGGVDETRFIFDAEGELHLIPASGSNTLISPSASSSFMGGNVGIGWTSPLSLLSVSGNLGIGPTSARSRLAAGTYLATDGNVGIGITTANSVLTVSGGVTIGGAYNLTAPTNGLLVQGNVGIGTTATGAGVLSIAGNVGIGFTGANVGPLPGLGLSVFGDVGIGTSIPRSKLEISGGVLIQGTNNLSFGSASDDGLNNEFISSPAGGWMQTAARSVISFFADTNANNGATANVYEFHTSDTAGNGMAKMVINNTGNIGIGTTNPGSTLFVSGNAGIGFTAPASAIAVPNLGLAIQGNVGIGITTANSTLSVAGSAHIGSLRQGIVAPANGLFVDGNVGIGATSTAYNLDVWGTGRFSSGLTVAGNLGIGTSLTVDSATALTTLNVSSVSNLSGNVGIGGSLTANSLSTFLSSILGADGSATAPAYSFNLDTNTGIFRPGTDALGFATGGSSRLTVTAAGNVGIGVTNPIGVLQVNGAAAIGYGSIPTSSLPTNGLAVSGNVGIGTTSPGQKLDVTGNVQGYLGGFGANNGGGVSTTATLNLSTTTAATSGVAQRGLWMGNFTSGSDATTSVDAISAGITTTNASYTTSDVTVIGAYGISKGASHTITRAWGLAINDLTVGTNNADLFIGGGSNLGTTFTGNWAIYNNTSKNSYLGTGNIGIGFTSPDRILQIALDADPAGTNASLINTAGTTQLALTGSTAGGLAKKLVLGIDTTDNYGVIQAGNTSGTNYDISLNPAGGNVGIGITTANSALTVNGGVSIGSSYNITAPTNGLIVQGNVGIGVTSPTTFNLQIAGSVGPNSNDGGTLGSASLSWSDLFLASGGVINFNNGDVTLTHAADKVTVSGGTLNLANNLVFDSALDIVVPANTAAALEISDGTTKLYVVDSRTGVNGLAGHAWRSPASISLPNSATAAYKLLATDTLTVTLAGTTQVTTEIGGLVFDFGASNINQSGGAVTVDKTSAVRMVAVSPGASVTLTDDIALHIVNAVATGTITKQYGLYVDSLTSGGSDYGVYIAGADTAALVAAAGNVGIGFTSPDRLTQIASDTDITATNASLLGAAGTQFSIAGSSVTGLQKKLVLGIDSTDNFGVIQAGNTSGTNYDLSLNPAGGNVGIGTTSPLQPLYVSGNAGITNNLFMYSPSGGTSGTSGSARIDIVTQTGDSLLNGLWATRYGSSGASQLGLRAARGTAANPSASQADDTIVNIGAFGYGTTAFPSQARAILLMNAAENWTDSAQGTYITFGTTPIGSTTRAERLRIDSAGNVGIGMTAPDRLLHIASDINIVGSNASLMGVNGTQFDISGATTNAAKKLVLGIDTTDNYGVIQAGNTDTTNYTLSLNPAGGSVGIGTTVPVGSGLTIDQGASDNIILAFKSSDVEHGVTRNSGDTHTFGHIQKASATAGGLYIEGIMEDGNALPAVEINGGSSGDTTKTTSGRGVFEFNGYRPIPTGGGSLAAETNVVAFRSNSVTRWIVDVEGDSWQQGTITASFNAANSTALCWDNLGESAITDCTGGPSADYAEIYPTEDDVDYGELVTIGENKVVISHTEVDATGSARPSQKITVNKLAKAGKPYDQKIIGITSQNWSDFSSTGHGSVDEKNHPLPVALSGRVPVKVSTENGPIQIGDYLTSSSIPGVAMKATRPGQVVGKALEEYSNPDPHQWGKILTFVNISYADPGNFLASLSLDSDGNLIIPKIKTASIILDPSVATASYVLRASETSVAISTDPTYTDPGPQLASNSNTSVDLSGKLASLEERLAALERQVSSKYQVVSSVDEESTASATIANKEEASDSASLATNYLLPTTDLDLTPPDILLATPSATLASLNTYSDATVSGMLAAYQAEIQDSFKVFGDTTLGKTTIAGNLNIDGTFTIENGSEINIIGSPSLQGDALEPQGGILYLQKSSLAQGLDIFNGKVIIDRDGKLSAKTLVADQIKVNEGKSAGVGKILAGQTEVIIENPYVEDNSIILITPHSAINQIPAVTEREGQTIEENAHFKVKLIQPELTDINFDYLIVGIEKKLSSISSTTN